MGEREIVAVLIYAKCFHHRAGHRTRMVQNNRHILFRIEKIFINGSKFMSSFLDNYAKFTINKLI